MHAAGGFPLEFGTISVSDGISMGHEGMHFSLVSREIIADSVETVMQAERLDGSVLLAGCDKSLPGMLMAAARLDLASVFLYAGSIAPGVNRGRHRKDVTIIDAFEAVGACARGLMTREEVDRIERAICPGEGACGGMYTANTMASVVEAMGMSLPGSAAPPAVDRRRDAFAHHSGEAVVELLRQGITARQIMTKQAFENAIAVVMAFGGSTNAVLHLLAIAHEAEVDLTLDDFSGSAAGAAPGRPQAVRPLRHERRRPGRRRPGGYEGPARRRPSARRLPDGHGQDGRGEPGRHAPPDPDGTILRALDNPIHKTGGITILHGSLAPEGAVVKSRRLRLRRVRGYRALLRARARRDGRAGGRHDHAGDVVVIRYEGPKGGPGMREMLAITARSKAPAWARTSCCSPTAASPVAPLGCASATSHPRPSTAARSLRPRRRPDPLDVANGAGPAGRRSGPGPAGRLGAPAAPYTRGVLAKYAQLVQSASKGAVLI